MIKNRLIACLVLVCSFGCLASCSVDTSKKPSDKADFKTDSNIKVYTRPTTSGTRECFFEKIGYAKGKKGGLVSGTNEVAEMVICFPQSPTILMESDMLLWIR